MNPDAPVRFAEASAPRDDEAYFLEFLRAVGLPDGGRAVLTRGDRETLHRILRTWARAPPTSREARDTLGALYAEFADLEGMPPSIREAFQSLAGPFEKATVVEIPPPEPEPEPMPEPAPEPEESTATASIHEPVPPPPEEIVPPPPPDVTEEERKALETMRADLAAEKDRLASWTESKRAEVDRRQGMVQSQLDELHRREAAIAGREGRIHEEERRLQERAVEVQRRVEESHESESRRALYFLLFSMEGVSRSAARALADAFVSEERLRSATVEEIAGVAGVPPEEAALVRDAFSAGALHRRDLREKAEDLLEDERFEESLEVFDAIVRENPEDIDAWFNRSEVLNLLGRGDEAVASLERVLAIDPGHKATLRELTNLLSEQGDFGLAAAHLNELLKRSPEEADRWIPAAADLLAQGKATEATLIYNAILEGDPTNLAASLALGDLLLAMDDVPRADLVYSRALQHHPDSPEALLKKGLLLNRQGRWGAAVQLFNRAISLRWDYPEAWEAKGQVLLTQGKTKDALECFDRLVSFDETKEDAWLGKAEAHLSLGENDKAAEAAGRALSLDKGNEGAQRVLERLREAADRPRPAPVAVEELPPKETFDMGILLELADSLLEANEPDAALRGFEEVLAQNPTHDRALFGKGRALHALDRYEEALRTFTEALKASPGNEEYERWRKMADERVRKEGA
jgi:tetratricopeptide (TPR) repeat protein